MGLQEEKFSYTMSSYFASHHCCHGHFSVKTSAQSCCVVDRSGLSLLKFYGYVCPYSDPMHLLLVSHDLPPVTSTYHDIPTAVALNCNIIHQVHGIMSSL